MLAIPLINTKYKRVFSSTKHLITDSYNRLKADIIKANKYLKSWFGRLKAKAFQQGVNLNINDLYKEEAAAKAAAKRDSNATGNTNKEVDKEADKEKDEEKDERKRSLVRAIATIAMIRTTKKMSNIWQLTVDLT